MELENVVQRIHRDFSFDLLEAVRDANQTAFLDRIKPELVPADVFADRVEYYRMNYPNNNFVTESQIEMICTKYGLGFGSIMGFSASIPIKNRIEIQKFQLHARDNDFVDHKMPGRIFRRITENGSDTNLSMDSHGTGGHVEMRSGYQPSNPDKPFEVIPVGEYFTLLMNPPNGDSYRIFLEVDVHGSPWFLEWGVGRIGSGDISFEWRQRHAGFRTSFPGVSATFRGKVDERVPQMERVVEWFADVRLRLETYAIQRTNRLSLTHNVSPMVVADPSMFKRYGDAIEKDGHRMKFKRSQIPAGAFLSFVDDPIVLQPVEYGYLVVTKWGAEANIPELTDSRQN